MTTFEQEIITHIRSGKGQTPPARFNHAMLALLQALHGMGLHALANEMNIVWLDYAMTYSQEREKVAPPINIYEREA